MAREGERKKPRKKQEGQYWLRHQHHLRGEIACERANDDLACAGGNVIPICKRQAGRWAFINSGKYNRKDWQGRFSILGDLSHYFQKLS